MADDYAQVSSPSNQVQCSSTQVKPAKGSNHALEELKSDLKACGIPQQDWKYYVTEPQAWDCNIISNSGLSHGVEVVLTAPMTSKPI